MTHVTYRRQADRAEIGNQEGRVPHPKETVVVAGQAYAITHIIHVPGSDQAVVEVNALTGRDAEKYDIPEAPV